MTKLKYTFDEIFRPGSGISSPTIIRFILKNNLLPYLCAVCGLSGTWRNKPLKLRLDHINGDHNNNTFSNLRFICPNCDSQSSTYLGHNRIYISKPENTCPKCGKKIYRKSKHCQKCNLEILRAKRKMDR